MLDFKTKASHHVKSYINKSEGAPVLMLVMAKQFRVFNITEE